MMHVVVTSYNNGPWYERCLESIRNQSGEFDCLVIDDVTDDGSELGLAELSVECGFHHVRNRQNLGKVGNLWTHLGLLQPAPADPILLVDGDDFLAHDEVISRLLSVYEDPEVWQTYGQYDPHPENNGQALAQMYSPEVIRARSYRTCRQNLFNHPLTFRYFLFQALEEDDLRAEGTGAWFHGGEDFVLMAPFLEFSTPETGEPHWRFLDEVLYRYNAINPLSEVSVKLDKIVESRQIHNRPIKEPLTL